MSIRALLPGVDRRVLYGVDAVEIGLGALRVHSLAWVSSKRGRDYSDN
jgi:hypothetical protein